MGQSSRRVSTLHISTCAIRCKRTDDWVPKIRRSPPQIIVLQWASDNINDIEIETSANNNKAKPIFCETNGPKCENCTPHHLLKNYR
eukprot:scaffold111248_cov28-Attheya_sp.AAC.1